MKKPSEFSCEEKMVWNRHTHAFIQRPDWPGDEPCAVVLFLRRLQAEPVVFADEYPEELRQLALDVTAARERLRNGITQWAAKHGIEA